MEATRAGTNLTRELRVKGSAHGPAQKKKKVLAQQAALPSHALWSVPRFSWCLLVEFGRV